MKQDSVAVAVLDADSSNESLNRNLPSIIDEAITANIETIQDATIACICKLMVITICKLQDI